MKNVTNKSPVAKKIIENHFGDQLFFLKKSCANFDAGDTIEYRRIAVALRILLHSTRCSISLLKQLELEGTFFPSFARKINEKNLLPEFSLAHLAFSAQGAKWLPALGSDIDSPRQLTFDSWWSETVFRDEHRQHLDRRFFVTVVADQDGGAHVDPSIDQKYHQLVNEGSFGWAYSNHEGDQEIPGIERVYLRHIAFETLLALEPQFLRMLGNRQCICGSKRKGRYCCHRGLTADEILKFWSS